MRTVFWRWRRGVVPGVPMRTVSFKRRVRIAISLRTGVNLVHDRVDSVEANLGCRAFNIGYPDGENLLKAEHEIKGFNGLAVHIIDSECHQLLPGPALPLDATEGPSGNDGIATTKGEGIAGATAANELEFLAVDSDARLVTSILGLENLDSESLICESVNNSKHPSICTTSHFLTSSRPSAWSEAKVISAEGMASVVYLLGYLVEVGRLVSGYCKHIGLVVDKKKGLANTGPSSKAGRKAAFKRPRMVGEVNQ